MGLKNPFCMSEARLHFESKDGQYSEADFPQHFTIVGLISGHRRVQLDPDLTQVYLELTQGMNEEFRLRYEGNILKTLSDLSLSRHILM